MMFPFHSLLTGTIKSATKFTPLPSTRGDNTLGRLELGSQFSPQIYIALLDPILHFAYYV